MLIHNETGARTSRRFWRGAIAVMVALAVFVVVGCASSTSNDDTDDTFDTGAGQPPPAPIANVGITYHKPGDTMVRATVSKFFGAQVIANSPASGGRTTSIVRFDGGVPIWEIKADHGLAAQISPFGKGNYAPKTLKYGTVPDHYQQIIPDEGPPEPLDRGAFYVFTIERASGSTSYEAVKVLADGSLEAYAAEPRAGSSYVMCCNLVSDFTEPVVVPEDINPDDVTPDNPDNPDNSNSAPSSNGY